MTNDSASASAKIALVLLAISTPALTWWLVGPLEETSTTGQLDYIAEAPSIDPATETAAGVASALVVCASLAVLAFEARQGRVGRRWLPVAFGVLLSGLAIGAAARLVTAGTAGANIGGGLILLVLPAILLVGWAIVVIRFTRARQYSQAQP